MQIEKIKIVPVLIIVIIMERIVNFNFECDEIIKNKYSSP